MQKLNLSNYKRMTSAEINEYDFAVSGFFNKDVKSLDLCQLRMLAQLDEVMVAFRGASKHSLVFSNRMARKALEKISLTSKE